MRNVVTYQDTRDNTTNICSDCEAKQKAAGTWPKNAAGEEYCSVSHGLHVGTCDLCERTQDDT